MMDLKIPTQIVHITHIRNLASILTSGVLQSCTQLRAKSVNYVDIANTGIQDRRATFPVPVPPGGILHDYVPFYFHPRSPMLYVISRGGNRYPEGQTPIIQLVTTAQSAMSNGPCVFTDGHAIMTLSAYFTDLGNLAKIDWEVMRAKYWTDTLDDPDRKRRRQAEFLVHREFPWGLVTEVAVFHRDVQSQVLTILTQATHQPPVNVRRSWYY